MTVKLFHHSHMQTIGGVERLILPYLLAQRPQPFSHGLMVADERPHPSLKEKLKSLPLLYAKFFKGIKVPHLFRLRRLYQQRLLKNVPLIVYWNSEVLSLSQAFLKRSSLKELYYDHGASWFLDPTSKGGKRFERMQGYIACSKASKRMIELKWPELNQTIHLLQNPLRPSLMDGSPQTPKKLFQAPLKLGCSGRLVPLKGFISCFHLLKVLQKQGIEANLTLAGTGKDLVPLQSAAKALGVASKVQFLSHVEDMPSFFDSLDLFLCPSFRESFGLVALEAQARGLPVIVNAVDGLPETLQEGKTGFAISPTLSPHELAAGTWQAHDLPSHIYHPQKDQLGPPLACCPEKMAEKIQQLIQDPKGYTQMSQQAKTWACQHFSFTSYVEKLDTLLSQTLT